jgi:hypothetical protein
MRRPRKTCARISDAFQRDSRIQITTLAPAYQHTHKTKNERRTTVLQVVDQRERWRILRHTNIGQEDMDRELWANTTALAPGEGRWGIPSLTIGGVSIPF